MRSTSGCNCSTNSRLAAGSRARTRSIHAGAMDSGPDIGETEGKGPVQQQRADPPRGYTRSLPEFPGASVRREEADVTRLVQPQPRDLRDPPEMGVERVEPHLIVQRERRDQRVHPGHRDSLVAQPPGE